MRIASSINLINHYSNESNYSKARSLIQKEWNQLSEYRHYQLLNHNAKQLFQIIQEEKELGESTDLTQSEKNILTLVNQSIRDLRLPYAKRIFLEHYSLYEKPAAKKWLTSEAKFVCDSWRKSQ